MKIINQLVKEELVPSLNLKESLIYLYEFNLKIKDIENSKASEGTKKAANVFLREFYNEHQTELDNWNKFLQMKVERLS